MSNCVELAKALIARQIISNDGFVQRMGEIVNQIDGLNQGPKTAAITKRIKYLEEALEVTYLSTILDLPRSEILRNKIVRRIDKTMTGPQLLEQKKQLFNLIDSVRHGDANLPEGFMDNILERFELTQDQFNRFFSDVTETANRKITLEYVSEKNYNLKKLFNVGKKDGLSESDFNKFLKDGKLVDKTLEIYGTEFDEYLSQMSRDFKSSLTPEDSLKGDELKKVRKINQSIEKEAEDMMTNYIISKALLNENLEPSEIQDLLKMVKGNKVPVKQPEPQFAPITYVEDKARGKTRLEVPGPEGSQPGSSVITFTKEGDPKIQKIDQPRTQEGVGIEKTGVYRRVVEWMSEQGYERFFTTPDTVSGKAALESLEKKGIIKAEGEGWVIIKPQQVSTTPQPIRGIVNEQTIASLESVEDIRNMLYLYLPEFKDVSLLEALRNRVDELNFGKNVKIKKMLDALEKTSDNPSKSIENLLELTRRRKTVKKPTESIDPTKVQEVVLERLTGKVVKGELYYYKPADTFSEEALAARRAAESVFEKFSVEIGDVTTISRDSINKDLNVVVDNVITAKLINDVADPITPNLYGDNKSFGFFEKNGKLYIGASNERDFKALLDTLDDINLSTPGFEDADAILQANKIRFGDNYEKAVAIMKSVAKSENYLDQQNYIAQLNKVNPKFEPRVGNKAELVQNLPDDVNFYKNEAIRIASDYGFTIEETTKIPLSKTKLLYGDLILVDPSDIGNWNKVTQEFLNMFGATGKVVTDGNQTAVFINTINSLTNDGFNLPSAHFRETFIKILNGERITNQLFIDQFITKNRDKLIELEGFTDVDKVKNYLTRKLTQAKDEAANAIDETVRPSGNNGYGLYMRRVDNTYLDIIPDDVDLRIMKGTSETIEADFKVIDDILEEYLRNVKRIVDSKVTGKEVVTEQEFFLESRRAMNAIQEYEESILLPRYSGLIKNSDILTRRYEAIKVTSVNDIEQLEASIRNIRQEFTDISKVEVNIGNARDSIEKRGVAFIDLGNGKKTSTPIDELIRKELTSAGSDIDSVRNLDLSKFSNKEKYEILVNIKASRLAPKTGNAMVQMYEAAFPALKGFFDDYEMVNSMLMSSDGSPVQLPKLLARSNATAALPDNKMIGTLEDLNIKKAILERISPIVKTKGLTEDELRKQVTSVINEYGKIGEFDPSTIGASLADLERVYMAQFKPYTMLVGIPAELINDFAEGVKNKIATFDGVRLSDVSVTVDGKIKPLSSAMVEPEKSFPNVIMGEQTFAKPSLEVRGEEFVRKVENNIKLARDDIKVIDQDLEIMFRNTFGEVSVILDKSPRLKQMKEVLLGGSSKSKNAGLAIKTIKTKEQLVGIQAKVRELMVMTDEAFDALPTTYKEVKVEQFLPEAYEIAAYFRYMNNNMKKLPLDENIRKLFSAFEKRFLDLLPNQYGRETEGIGTAIRNQQIFNIVPYKKATEYQQVSGRMGLINMLDDQIELDAFNKAFQSNLTMNDFQRVLIAWSDLNLNGTLQKIRNNYNKFMSHSLLGGFYTRVLTSRPRGVLMLPQQIFGYKSLEYGLQNKLGNVDWNRVETIRRNLGLLTADIPEVTLGTATDVITSALGNGFNRGGVGGLQEAINKIRTANISFIFDAVKDNANNLVDVIFGRAIKNRAFMDSILHNGYRTFYSLDEFETFLKNAPLNEKQRLIQAVDSKANEMFQNVMGFSQDALFRNTSSGVTASLRSIFEKTLGFRSGWGLNMAKRGYKKLSRGGEVGMYMARNGFSGESIDNAVAYFMKDRDVGTFFSTMMWDAYYATKLKRWVDTRQEREEDESFFDFLGNELTDLEGWRETLMAMSQGTQALYSAGPLRPFLFAAEVGLGIGERDGSMTNAFLEGVRGAAFRQFKLINNLTAVGTNFAGEVALNGFRYDSFGDNTATAAIADLMWQTSAGTLKFMLMDRDYQKNLYYVPESFDTKEWLMGININPYFEEEFRIQSLANSATLENDPALAMKNIFFGTYLGKWVNNIRYPLQYGLGRYNQQTKNDFALELESNPVYRNYINDGRLDLSLVPDAYRSDVYKNTEKRLTGSGWMPGSPKQEDVMSEYLQKHKDEDWREKQEKRGGPSRAAMEILDFIGPEVVQELLDASKDVQAKSGVPAKREELVYNYIKSQIDAVPLEKKPYGYYYLDLAHYLTRGISSKGRSRAEVEMIRQGRVDRALEVFMDRDPFELEQAVYRDVRDNILMEALYYSDTEAFKPFFTVTEGQRSDYVTFDSGYKGFMDGMTQTLMAASKDDLNGFEVAFSNLIKAYKDRPYAAVAVYNELATFFEGRPEIENKDDMLNWFLIKNSELLEDPEKLRQDIGDDMYNELLFNIKRREDEIQAKLLDLDDGTGGGGGKLKKSDAKFAGMKPFDKLSKATGASPKGPSVQSTSGKTPGRTYGNPRAALTGGDRTGPKDFGRYDAKSVDIRGTNNNTKKDINRRIKALRRKTLTDKNLGLK